MKCFITFLFLIAGSFALAIHSQASSPSSDPYKQDAYIYIVENGVQIKKPLDISIRRSFKLLDTQAHLAVNSSQSYYKVANVYHKGEFHVAYIPKIPLRVVMQEEIFQDLVVTRASHTQLRFKFDTPILLFKHGSKSSLPDDQSMEIVLSFEAVPYIGGPSYSLQGSMQSPLSDNDAPFGFTARLKTIEATYSHVVLKQNHDDKNYIIYEKGHPSNKLDSSELLRRGIETGAQYQDMQDNKYDLLYRNCTNTLFEIIDSVLGTEIPLLTDFFSPLPPLTKGLLFRRGIYQGELGSMRDELRLEK